MKKIIQILIILLLTIKGFSQNAIDTIYLNNFIDSTIIHLNNNEYTQIDSLSDVPNSLLVFINDWMGENKINEYNRFSPFELGTRKEYELRYAPSLDAKIYERGFYNAWNYENQWILLYELHGIEHPIMLFVDMDKSIINSILFSQIGNLEYLLSQEMIIDYLRLFFIDIKAYHQFYILNNEPIFVKEEDYIRI